MFLINLTINYSSVQYFTFQFALGVLNERISPRYLSGGQDLKRLLTRGQQTYDKDTGNSPLYKPIHKLEALSQVSGDQSHNNN